MSHATEERLCLVKSCIVQCVQEMYSAPLLEYTVSRWLEPCTSLTLNYLPSVFNLVFLSCVSVTVSLRCFYITIITFFITKGAN